MNEFKEFYQEDYFIRPDTTNSMEPRFTKKEREDLEILLAVEGEKDEKKVLDLFKNTVEFFTKENIKDIFHDDKKRRIAFEWLNLIAVTLAQMIGNIDSSNIELINYISANSVLLDEALKYLYEYNYSAGTIDLYNENDSEELSKERIKFFLPEGMKKATPETINQAISVLRTINNLTSAS